MTTSRFVGYEKHFFSVGVTEQTPKLYMTSALLLRGRTPKYAPHVSLLTMHLLKGSTLAKEIEETKSIFFSQISELTAPIVLDGDAVKNRRYELLGTAPECFCLVFDLVDTSRLQMLVDLWVETLCEKYKLTKSDVEAEGVFDLISDDGTVLARISSTRVFEKKLHATLLRSFDLKKANKKVYKQYHKTEDRFAYLITHYKEL